MNGKLIRDRLMATTIVAGTVAFASPAFAQTTSDSSSVAAQAATATPGIAPAITNPANGPASIESSNGESASSNGGAIIVTGSRIPHPDLESASPVTVVGSKEFAVTGTTRTEDLLNQLPQVFAGQGGSISNGASGIATVDLRNLGPSRTLVLIDGHRLVPGDPRTPFSDINFIPSALIKRVDVLTGGASSVYGADAVAGVVNFVMDTDFSGFKVDGQYSFYNHDNRAGSNVTDALNARSFGYPQGMSSNGGTVDTTAVVGAGFDDNRGHVTAYIGYRRISAVTQSSRDYSACSLTSRTAAAARTAGNLYTCGGSATSANGTFLTNVGTYQLSGRNFVPGSTPYNFAPTNYYQRPDERYTAGFFAHYDVSDAFKPYMEFMFMDDRTVAQIAPSGDFGNTTTINCDNPLLSAQQVGIICQPGNIAGTATDSRGVTYQNAVVYPLRRNVEGGPRQDDLQHTSYRGLIGARGDIAKGFSYDASYQYGRTNFAETYLNDFSVTRLTRALNVVSVNGTPTCRSVVDGTDPSCVPYDIFGGGVSQAAINYLSTPGFQRGQTTEQVANANVTFLGSEYGLTSPLANEGFALNFGGEYRRETLNFTTDQAFSSGDLAGQGGATLGSSGSVSVREAFIEASLPVIQDRPFFKDLKLSAGYRRSYYTTSGSGSSLLNGAVTPFSGTNHFNTDTYKFEAEWAPVRDIKFRGSYNRAVRAPNVTELFGARSVALDGATDPCSGMTPTATLAQCALTGVTAAQYGKIPSNPANQYNGYQGGNPNLLPEVSTSKTAGVVLTPSFLRGLAVTVDYFDIKIKNVIGIYGGDNVINQCLAGVTSFCTGIVRDGRGSLYVQPTGYVTDLNTNAGTLRTKGIDLSAAYTQRLGSFGSLGLQSNVTYTNKLDSDIAGPADYDCAGYYGVICGTPTPKWRAKTRATFTSAAGPSLSLAWRYLSRVRDDKASPDPDLSGITSTTASTLRPGSAKIRAYSYFDLSAQVPVADKFTLTAGVNNLLDKSPPIVGSDALPAVYGNGNTFPQVYDALGRYIFVGITMDL